ncbi:MAG: hypothetical protein ACJ71H_03500 [Nitrososphaeraceae archaeon]
MTFLNIHQLERQGADIQSKVQGLEDLNSSLRERDKVKDDAIAHLSDQLLALSTRLQELERKQQTAISASYHIYIRFTLVNIRQHRSGFGGMCNKFDSILPPTDHSSWSVNLVTQRQ